VPVVVILDIAMPKLDGYEAVRRIVAQLIDTLGRLVAYLLES